MNRKLSLWILYLTAYYREDYKLHRSHDSEMIKIFHYQNVIKPLHTTQTILRRCKIWQNKLVAISYTKLEFDSKEIYRHSFSVLLLPFSSTAALESKNWFTGSYAMPWESMSFVPRTLKDVRFLGSHNAVFKMNRLAFRCQIYGLQKSTVFTNLPAKTVPFSCEQEACVAFFTVCKLRWYRANAVMLNI